MLFLHGRIHGTFISKRGTSKDGNEYGGADKVQILVSEPQEDGTKRDAFVDLKTNDAKPFAAHVGKSVEVPVGAFSPTKGSVVFYMVGPPRIAS